MNTNPTAKRILCYGDSLTFGTIPGSKKRYGVQERWPGMLQKLLGDTYEIIEEGLGGRTTNLEDPNSVGRNGLTYFQPAMLSHVPLDMVIILLGSNDLKEKFQRSAKEIADVFVLYKQAIEFACTYRQVDMPKILLLSPPLIDEARTPKEWNYTGGEAKSKLFATEYARVAKEIQAEFLDLSTIVKPSPIDGAHLEKDSNEAIAHALYQKIITI